MLPSASLALTAGTVDELAEGASNGRQIRNLTRLTKNLYPGGPVTPEQRRAVLRYGCA
jgi:hypothetical protein